MATRFARLTAWSSLLLLALAPAAVLAQNAYQQTNLVSDLPQLVGNDPNKVDPNLVNPWGISRGPNTPFWVSDNGTGVTTLYNGAGNIIPRVFTIPPPPGSPAGTTSAPTGQVFNGSSNFDGNFFIFATEDGTIAAWKPADGLTAQIVADSTPAGAIYKGITIAGDHLYAADFHNGRIDVFDSGFNPTTLAGNFRDPNLPTGYAPFNIQNIGDKLYVTYALQDSNAEDDVPGLGHGFIDIFNPDGSMADHFASQGTLNSPWGLALAPGNFGAFSNDLLVGNFGDGRINAFDPNTKAFLGQLEDLNHNPIAIDGLWGITFGNGLISDANKLYFAAGINHEANGLFGTLQAVPEPGTLAFLAIGSLSTAGLLLRRRKS